MIPFVSTAFENGSRLDFEASDGRVEIQIVYDHQRGTGNRQGTHWHFRLDACRGAPVRVRIRPSISIYGGRPGNYFVEGMVSHLSVDGAAWTPMPFRLTADGGIEADLVMPADRVYIASLPPYLPRDVDALIARYAGHRAFSHQVIGVSAEGRPLAMIEVADPARPAVPTLLVRARAHPWETGGNWFMEGFLARILVREPSLLDRLSLCYLPMAAIDGVVRGYSRFNVMGADLNRGFAPGTVCDGGLAPENAALIGFLDRRRQAGRLPRLAVDIHNDTEGQLHVSPGPAPFLARMQALESAMRTHTYFREGSRPESAESETFGNGLRRLYGIDSVVFELNAIWCQGAGVVPTARLWEDFGSQFVDALLAYFSATAEWTGPG